MGNRIRSAGIAVGLITIAFVGCSNDNANVDQNGPDDDTVITDPAGVVNEIDGDENDVLGDG